MKLHAAENTRFFLLVWVLVVFCEFVFTILFPFYRGGSTRLARSAFSLIRTAKHFESVVSSVTETQRHLNGLEQSKKVRVRSRSVRVGGEQRLTTK